MGNFSFDMGNIFGFGIFNSKGVEFSDIVDGFFSSDMGIALNFPWVSEVFFLTYFFSWGLGIFGSFFSLINRLEEMLQFMLDRVSEVLYIFKFGFFI